MYKVQDYYSSYFTTMLLIQLYVWIAILLTCGKHVHDHISQSGDV